MYSNHPTSQPALLCCLSSSLVSFEKTTTAPDFKPDTFLLVMILQAEQFFISENIDLRSDMSQIHVKITSRASPNSTLCWVCWVEGRYYLSYISSEQSIHCL